MKKVILLIACIFATYFSAQAQLVTTFVGSDAGYVDATGLAAQFDNPRGLATDASGNIYVADYDNHKIRKVTPAGVVTTLAGSTQGNANGTGTAAQFNAPSGVAVDAAGNVYVADTGNHRIRKITPGGAVTTFAGSSSGYSDTAGFVRFNAPQDLALDASGNVYVADTGNHKIRKITSAGVVSTLAGAAAGFADGIGTTAQFNTPSGVATDASGNIFVADLLNAKIRKITPAGVVTTFSTQVLTGITRLVVDSSNHVYYSNSSTSNGHQVYRIDASGTGGTVLGTAVFGSIDGYGSQVRFYAPVGLAKNAAGDIYIAESGYNRLRKINIAPAKPVLSAISITPGAINATVNYTMGSNATTSTTSIIKYGLTAGSLINQVTGFSLTQPSSVADKSVLPNLVKNKVYFYQIVATNVTGVTTSAIGTFTTKNLIEYPFDNSFANTDGLRPFTANGTFATDRNGNTNGAVQIAANSNLSNNLTDLPIGSSNRTVSLWYKTGATNSALINLFSYGPTLSNLGNFALSVDSYGAPVLKLGYSNDYAWGTPQNPSNNWRHLVVTYDGAFVRMYSDGIFLTAEAAALNTGDTYCIINGGQYGYQVTLDDLQIYDYVLTQAEITTLHNNNTLAPQTAPSIADLTATPDATTAKFNYSLNANAAATTSIVKYGLSSSNLSNQIAGFAATGSTVTPRTTAAITGLASNTQYFYQVVATNTIGETSSAIQSFRTSGSLAEYTFDGTYNNVNNHTPFSTTAATAFATSRNTVSNNALSITSSATGSVAQIPNLPVGASSRSISLWYKVAANVNGSIIFSYGNAAVGETFGLYLGTNGNTVFQGYGASFDHDFLGTDAANNWCHVVLTYDDTTNVLTLYFNGVSRGSISRNLNTVGNLFKLGNNTTTTSIDDLQFYNYQLSQAQVTALFNNNTLSSQDFKKNDIAIQLYPNPANDVLNIEMTNEVKSIEIYNIQGQKVKSANKNQINVSDLANGMYMIKIEDSENGIATKKFLKE